MLILYFVVGGLLLFLTVLALYSLEIIPCTDKLAEARAEQLLRQHMTPHQYRQLQEQGYIEIPSRLHPNHLYRIFRRRQRVHIYTLDQANPSEHRRKLGELCVVTNDIVPDADLLLAHKWMIEGDERRYLAIANRISYQAFQAAFSE
jgi:hypothetical protein